MTMYLIEYGVLAVLCGVIVYRVFENRWEDVLFLSLAVLAVHLPFFLRKLCGIATPRAFRAALSLFVLATIFLGERVHFYDRFWWWDLMLHAIAGFGLTMIGHVIFALMYRTREVRPAPILLAAFAASLAMSGSVVWEIYEFAIDSIFGSNMQPSADDTMWDLIGAAAAALAAGYIGWRWHSSTREGGVLEQILDDGVRKNKEVVSTL